MEGMRELTEKEELFCQQYMADLNQTRAYMRAYDCQNYGTAATEAWKAMKKPEIATRIRELVAERNKSLNIDAEWVIQSLLEIRDKALQAKPVLKWNHETKQMEETGEYTFDGNAANKASELIGKHVGMWKDKLEIKVEGEVVIKGQKFANENND